MSQGFLIMDGMTEHLDKYKLIKMSQQGFLQDRSCPINVTEYFGKGHQRGWMTNIYRVELSFQQPFDNMLYKMSRNESLHSQQDSDVDSLMVGMQITNQGKQYSLVGGMSQVQTPGISLISQHIVKCQEYSRRSQQSPTRGLCGYSWHFTICCYLHGCGATRTEVDHFPLKLVPTPR